MPNDSLPDQIYSWLFGHGCSIVWCTSRLNSLYDTLVLSSLHSCRISISFSFFGTDHSSLRHLDKCPESIHFTQLFYVISALITPFLYHATYALEQRRWAEHKWPNIWFNLLCMYTCNLNMWHVLITNDSWTTRRTDEDMTLLQFICACT